MAYKAYRAYRVPTLRSQGLGHTEFRAYGVYRA